MSPKEFKDVTDATESVQTIAKHFRSLERLGCVQEIRKRRSGRTLECVFRAIRKPRFDDMAWRSVLAGRQQGITEKCFSSYLKRIAQATDHGTFDARDDRRFNWSSSTYDEIAWDSMVEAVTALFWYSVDLWDEAEQRLAESDAKPIPVTLGLTLIEAPPAAATLDRLQSAPFFLEESGQLYFDQNLAAGLTHSLRLMILSALRTGPMSPKEFHDKLGDPLDVELAKVAQQFGRLEELDCIELVEERKGRRGRPEKVYASTQRSLYDGSQWEAMPESLEAEVSAMTITTFIEAFANAVATDTADRRATSHVTWMGMRLDDRAWGSLVAMIEAVSRFAIELRKESSARLSGELHLGVPVMAALAAFESPKASPTSPRATLQKLEREHQPDRDALRLVLSKIASDWSRRPFDQFHKPK